tara:strand:- start:1768 stop:2289 length:522 start_codon:yes stop_codon:yes gene_type:complete
MKNMKNELLLQLIRESLGDFLYLTEEDDDEPTSGEQLSWLDGQGSQEIERRAAEDAETYYDESELSLPWDDSLTELANLLAGIALDIIDHYKGRPNFGREEAKEEILASIGVPMDIFIGKESEFGDYNSLDTLLDEEFGAESEEMNERPTTFELGNAMSNKGGMGELDEDRKE